MLPAGSRNAFSLVRWFFALSLVLFHGSVAAGEEGVVTVSPHAIICAFFVMSGMLTYASYLRSPGARAFYVRRVRKIVPPYAAVVVLATIGGFFITSLDAAAYASHPATLKYLAANLTFLNFLAPSLPGVFDANPVTAVNSSLWTMKVEVAFYLVLPALVWLMRRTRTAVVLAAMYVFSVAWQLAFNHLFAATGSGLYDMLARQLPGQMSYFAAGMAAVHLHETFMRRKYAVLLAGMALWAACDACAALRPAEPVAIAAVLTVLAYGSRRAAELSARIPNLTYEVYLLHFPIVQAMVWAGFFGAAGFYPVILTAAVLTVATAYVLHRTTH